CPMVNGHSRLNQGVNEAAFRGRALHPEVFPHFVGLEPLPAVEADDAGKVARIVRRNFIHGDVGLLENRVYRKKPFIGCSTSPGFPCCSRRRNVRCRRWSRGAARSSTALGPGSTPSRSSNSKP